MSNFDALTPTLFHQTWWLDIATGGRYDMVETKHNGRVVGRMPYFLERKFGHTVSLMPPLTHIIGPAVDEGEGTANTRFLRRLAVTRDLIRRLPAIAYFYQKLHRGIMDVLAFQMENYDSTVQFTHEIPPQPAVEIWHGMRDKTRNMVRKADRDFVCETVHDPDAFGRLYIDNLRARGMVDQINIPVCQALIGACLARDSGRIYAARQSDGTIVAAVFCAWDTSTAYYLMTTRTLASGNSAVTLLLWKAISDATARGLIFDFDGVASAGAVLFYAGFGGQVQPRYIVSKGSDFLQMLNRLRRVVGKRKSPFN